MARRALASRILSALSSGNVSCPHHAFDGAHVRTITDANKGSAAKEYAFEMIYSTLRFGVDVTKEIGHDVENLGLKNTLVLTDPSLTNLHAFKTVTDTLTKADRKFSVFESVAIEPTDKSFQEAINFAREGKFDSFIAVGGGSVIDTAKAAALFAANPKAEFLDLVCPPFGKQMTPEKQALPLIAVPTTAGTGSETTTVAVFDFVGKDVKSAIRQKAMKPHLAIVDPLNVVSMPKHVAVYSGFDVLCHALESYTAKPFRQRVRPQKPKDRPVYQGSNPISDVWAREALEIIDRYFRRSVQDQDDLEAKSHMLMASSYAGMGFGNAGVHLCHGLSYPISGQGKTFIAPDYPSDHALIPHGLSVILTACADFRFTCDACPDRHLAAASFLGLETTNKRSSDAGDILADGISGYMQDFGVANGLEEVGFKKDNIPSLVQAALTATSALNLAPKEQTTAELHNIYENSMRVY